MSETKKYRIFVKYKGCQGQSCRRCEDYLPGFFQEHNGSIELSEWALLDKISSEVISQAITSCPVGALGFEGMER